MPSRAGVGTWLLVQWLLADVERSHTQNFYNISSHSHEMRNALKQDGEAGLASHIAGEEASLLPWAVMVYPTWNKKGSDSGAPCAGPCVSQDKVRSASLTPQLGRAVSQHPCGCEIWGSPVGRESEQEAEEPTGAVPVATAGTQGQQRQARLPSLHPEMGDSQFPALLLAGDSCRVSFNRAGKPRAWSPPCASTSCPLALGGPQGTWTPHRG